MSIHSGKTMKKGKTPPSVKIPPSIQCRKKMHNESKTPESVQCKTSTIKVKHCCNRWWTQLTVVFSRWKHRLGFYTNLSRFQCAVTGGCHGDTSAERCVAVVGSGLASPGESVPQQVIQAALCAIVGGWLDFQKICLFFKGDKTAIKRCLGFYTYKTELEWISFNPQKSHCNSTSRLLHFENIPVLPPFPLLPVLSTSSQRGLPLPSSQRTPSSCLSEDSLCPPQRTPSSCLSKRTPSLNPPCCHPSLLVRQEGSVS